jgi:hypothetical protein
MTENIIPKGRKDGKTRKTFARSDRFALNIIAPSQVAYNYCFYPFFAIYYFRDYSTVIMLIEGTGE